MTRFFSLSLSFLSSRRGSSVRRMQAIAWSSRTFSLFCRPLRRGKSASERSLPRFPPQRTLLRFVHLLLPPPACSNYEKECSFATRRGTRNGQRPLETIIEQRGPLCLSIPSSSSPLLPPFSPEFLIRPRQSQGKHFPQGRRETSSATGRVFLSR